MWLRVIIIFFLLLVLFIFYWEIRNYIAIILSIIIAIISIIICQFYTKNSVKKLLKYETSKQLLIYYDKILKNSFKAVIDLDAWKIYYKSIICCYYGESEAANQMLSLINWSERIPYIQSL
jgi:hypothetical protein